MYTRALSLPNRSFFLFGPRGTGKTTWLKQKLPQAKWFDLLKSEEFLPLLREPQQLRMIVEALPKGSWIVIDEVQRLPSLLNEVHALIFAHGEKYKFALSGSSARKLKRLDSNLLAGRALHRNFFPLSGSEIDFSLDAEALLSHGMLPSVVVDPSHAVEFLESYATTYLREEIQQEALVANLGSFSRFLEVAALSNGQIVNVAGIARDAGVARPSVQRYFDVLNDTMIGCWIRPWVPRIKVRESAHPKFYFFDTGVVRALRQTLRDPLDDAERGPLLELLVLHELRSHIGNNDLGGEVRYWRTPAGVEVDFIWTRGKKAIGLEVKATKRWRSEDGKSLKELLEGKKVQSAFGIYLGRDVLQDEGVRVLPFQKFQQELSEGKIIF